MLIIFEAGWRSHFGSSLCSSLTFVHIWKLKVFKISIFIGHLLSIRHCLGMRYKDKMASRKKYSKARVFNLKFTLGKYPWQSHRWRCYYCALLPIFISKRNIKFQSEINENDDVIFSEPSCRSSEFYPWTSKSDIILQIFKYLQGQQSPLGTGDAKVRRIPSFNSTN